MAVDVGDTVCKMGKFACVGTLLVVGISTWTNWYFSPGKRLERLAHDMQVAALQAVSHEENVALMGALRVKAGGTTSVSTSCTAIPCTVTMVQNFVAQAEPEGGGLSWNFVVSFQVEPYIVDPFLGSFVPTQIRWRGSDWRGRATFDPGPAKGVADTGCMAQLDMDLNVDRANVIALHLHTLAGGMRRRLRS